METPSTLPSVTDPTNGSVLADSVLEKLKDLAPAGCVLCSLDAWEGDEWE